MKRSILPLGIFGILTMFALANWSTSQEPSPAPKDDDANLNNPIEVQTRGPLHEAFAQPFDDKPQPGPMVPKQPPPAIPEEPPEVRPDDENAQWIPGYWAWDDQRQDYMWVSGVYRVPPPNRTFVPGYWSSTADGWRWIPGFWSGAEQNLPYTPEPPAPLDNGPQMPAPDDDSTYIPGVWVYRDARFLWRPGYWAPYQTGRVWVSPSYCWTPNGYLFVDGYWDWPFASRGLIYAPVCFNQPLWLNAGWRFRPSFVVGFNGFFDSAFVRVGGLGFYFGNYCGPNFANAGYRPWYNGRGRYDAAFTHYTHNNQRANPNWYAGVQQTYAGRASGKIAAPPATFAQQAKFAATKGITPPVTPAGQFKSAQVKTVKASPAQLQTHQQFVQTTRDLGANRQRIELAHAASATKGAGETRSLRMQSLTESKGVLSAPRSPDVRTGGVGTVPSRTFGDGKSGQASKSGDGPSSSQPRVVDLPSGKPGQATKTLDGPATTPGGSSGGLLPQGAKIVNKQPAVTTLPKVTNTLPTAPKVTNTLPTAPRVTNTLPTNPAPPRIIATPTPTPFKATPSTPAPKATVFPSNPAPRVTTPAPRVTTPPPRVQTPAPRVTTPPPRSAPAPVRRK